MADYAFGLTGELLRDAAGATATTEIENVRDVTLTNTTVEADTTSRKSVNWKSSKVILLESVLTFDMLDDLNDDDGAITAVRTAWSTKASIALYPKDATAGEGLDADWNITSFTRNEPLEDVITYSVEAKPNNEDREPIWA